MKIAIMQPYFFPYIGYFQLIHASDLFVLYDDVNFIKQGWINRNYILSNGMKQRITLHLYKAGSFRLINEVKTGDNAPQLVKTIHQTYARAPFVNQVIPLIEEILLQKEENLAVFLEKGIRKLCAYLGISTQICISSNLKKDSSLKGQKKVLAICREVGCTQYINLPGGKRLYDKRSFLDLNIDLAFIKPTLSPYNQGQNAFVSQLSIIDVMMYNPLECINRMLEEYVLE